MPGLVPAQEGLAYWFGVVGVRRGRGGRDVGRADEGVGAAPEAVVLPDQFRTGRDATALSRRTGSGRTGPPARGSTPYDRTVILRCTRRLLTVLGSAVAEPAPAPDPEDWYANLLWFDRLECLLLTHSATLFLRRNINSARGYCPPIELAARRLVVGRSRDLEPRPSGSG